MWILNARTRRLESFEGKGTPKYAILSHRWEAEEVTFRDIRKGQPESLHGYRKLDGCCKRALSQGLDYVWIDTCCIDKKSSAEVSQAINSMYKWYRSAKICYAFLSDVGDSTDPSAKFAESVWFTRGWTLQELLAPWEVEFCNSEWTYFGSKLRMRTELSNITGISSSALEDFRPEDFGVRERMSWASRRTTTREEDAAYSLLGMFNVNMPLLYGEGAAAFTRLQEEIIKTSEDRSIFCWTPAPSTTISSTGFFAHSPADFMHRPEDCTFQELQTHSAGKDGFDLSNAGLRMKMDISPLFSDIYLAFLGRSKQNSLSHDVYIFIRPERDEGIFSPGSTVRCRRVWIDGVNWICTPHAEPQVLANLFAKQTVTKPKVLVELVIVRGKLGHSSIGTKKQHEAMLPVESPPKPVSEERPTVTALSTCYASLFDASRAMRAFQVLRTSPYRSSNSELIMITRGFDWVLGLTCVLEIYPSVHTQYASHTFGLGIHGNSFVLPPPSQTYPWKNNSLERVPLLVSSLLATSKPNPKSKSTQNFWRNSHSKDVMLVAFRIPAPSSKFCHRYLRFLYLNCETSFSVGTADRSSVVDIVLDMVAASGLARPGENDMRKFFYDPLEKVAESVSRRQWDYDQHLVHVLESHCGQHVSG